ncbi:MAG: F0F1 ATP synthase subunit A [Bdellovibrionota bacterium]|nr:F0F1 ATP synthase subunit A [Bdellovibrionota bacterium]
MSAAHFNWTQLIPGVGHDVHIATAAVVATGIVGLAFVGKLSLGKGEQAIAPAGSFGLRGMFEGITELIVYLTDMVFGEGHRKFVPLFGAMFTFILINNLVGLLPGMTPATDNINTTVAVGMFSFIMYNWLGFKEHGMAYFKHYLGPILWMAPIMLPIEIISNIVRPFSLGIRLMANMTADHTVLGIFLELTPIAIPVIFYGLGTFVCFVQSLIFTLLSMVYVSMATSHDH